LLFKWDTSFFVSFLPFKTTPPCGFQNAPISIPFYALMIRPIKGRTNQRQITHCHRKIRPPCKRRPDHYIDRIFKQAWWQKHSICSMNGWSGSI
jgi:hypothetical protein